MFDDFDLYVNCEERGYEEEAFHDWYGESFENYCDELERTAKIAKSYQNIADYDEI